MEVKVLGKVTEGEGFGEAAGEGEGVGEDAGEGVGVDTVCAILSATVPYITACGVPTCSAPTILTTVPSALVCSWNGP